MSKDDSLTFSAAPHAEFEHARGERAEHASNAPAEGRLRALLRTDRAVGSHLDLATMLRAMVDTAMDLVDARFAALAVLDEHGGLEEFIHVGMTGEQARAIGHLPEGRGLMRALIDDPEPIRIESIADDPRSVGFPDGHVKMSSFLGVPIRVGDAVYGHIYLADHARGRFSLEDEELITSLAAGAGFAIANARAFSEAEAGRAWAAAAAEITSALLSGDPHDAMVELVDGVERLSDADLVCVLSPAREGTALTVVAARGSGANRVPGTRRRIANPHLNDALETLRSRRVDAFGDGGTAEDHGWPSGPALIVPFGSGGEHPSILLALRRQGSRPFSRFELERAADVAVQTGRAMELASTRSDRQRMRLLEDRARIARDLHDHVIQQLFAIGLDLQNVENLIGPGQAAERIDADIGRIDDAIGQIRTIVFALSQRPDDLAGVRRRVLDIADEVNAILAHPAHVTFSGPVDLVVDDDIADDLLAVVREGLTNVARHARAAAASISVGVTSDQLVATIHDDGIGIGTATRRSGLANCAGRAHRHDGTFTIDSDATGTRLSWAVPLAP
ncbi:GAF domain-containing protein [Agromyces sp. NPDC058484]|uniref:GAF domain-containing protein n=1 Tax=Agromyces sp. NPDC058484 TaxID=3346524 RepID=UPI00364EC2A9